MNPGNSDLGPTGAGTVRRRTPLWYVKFVAASYAAGIASLFILFFLVFVVGGAEVAAQWSSLPVFGVRLPGLAVLALGAAWSPFMWRKLR
jgi:hypothetical protein